jgi:6-pyruvoyltetrahydropterin/6-carboxytetrahydropterin synthase
MVKVQIFFEASFNSAHYLPHVAEDHKCRRMHGHTYRVRIVVGGSVGEDGMIVDYDRVRDAWMGLYGILDHHVLNEIPGLENPTCEIIAPWILAGIAARFPTVDHVEVRETETCGAIARFSSDPLPARAL